LSRKRLLVSACLLGHRTRYDGRLKRVAQVCDLSPRFDLVPVCPEVDCGLPTPRAAMRLEGPERTPRLVAIETREDHTGRMSQWIVSRIAAIPCDAIAGCILKSRSPSCGLSHVPRFTPEGMDLGAGMGLFAHALVHLCPSMPVIEDDLIEDTLAAFVARLR